VRRLVQVTPRATIESASSSGPIATDEGESMARDALSRTRSGRLLRLLLVLSLGTSAAWLIVSGSLAAYLAPHSPHLALVLAPNEPNALLTLAERVLQPPPPAAVQKAPAAGNGPSNDPTPSSPTGTTPAVTPPVALTHVRGLVERALASEPTSERAMRLMAVLAEQSGDKARAIELYRVAARRSLHESYAVFRMLMHSIEAGDWKTSVAYADTMMRTRLDLVGPLGPLIARLVETDAARPHLIEHMAARPNWRQPIFEAMLPSVTNHNAVLDLILGLGRQGSPLTHVEMFGYLQFLLGKGQYDVAYYAWLQQLPPEQLAVAGNIFNGSFDLVGGGLAFDWAIQSGPSFSASLVTLPEQGPSRALKIEFGSGRVRIGAVQQLLVLAPGRYRLTARVRGEMQARKGLQWQIACFTLDDGRTLGVTTPFIGTQRTWRELSLSFEVPEKHCQSQRLRLVHDAQYSAEQFASGTLWYDDFRIFAEPQQAAQKR
jgi:hypothetical protein